MIKRILAIFLAVLTLLTSCGRPDKVNPVDTNETADTSSNTNLAPLDSKAVSDVCIVWENYLDTAQIMAQTEAWGLGYIKAYCENPSVIGLQRAISATEAVVATLNRIELPECDLSSEALSALADSGVDMSFVTLEYDDFRRRIENSKLEWDSMLHSLMTESFWEYGIEYIEGWMDVRFEKEEVYTLYCGKMTNAVALSLNIAREDSSLESWQENYPNVFHEDFVWTEDEDQLTSEMSALIDRLEELTVKSAELNGVLAANYAMFENAMDTGDWSAVNSVTVTFEDHFLPIPMPEWQVTRVYSYKYDDEANDAIWTTVGDDLTVCPEGLIIKYEEITFDEFSSYVDFLASLGVKYYADGSTTEGESISLLYLDYCTMSLKWNDGVASIYFYDSEPLLVPSWYLGYLLVSLN